MAKSSIYISIGNPCREKWEQMAPSEIGRFCDNCKKQVIDFTTWDDAALYNYFKQHGHNTCGRFNASQLNRPITIPYQAHSRLYHIVVAMGLVILSAQSVDAQNEKRPPQIHHHTWNAATNKLIPKPTTLLKDTLNTTNKHIDIPTRNVPPANIRDMHTQYIIDGMISVQSTENKIIKPSK